MARHIVAIVNLDFSRALIHFSCHGHMEELTKRTSPEEIGTGRKTPARKSRKSCSLDNSWIARSAGELTERER
jgi:hypothetical protein